MNTTDFSFRPLRLPEDAALLHRWVSTEQARFWGLTGASRQRVQEEYRQLLATKDYRVLLGQRDGQPRFLVELYDPATSPLAEAYHVVPGMWDCTCWSPPHRPRQNPVSRWRR